MDKQIKSIHMTEQQLERVTYFKISIKMIFGMWNKHDFQQEDQCCSRQLFINVIMLGFLSNPTDDGFVA